MLLSRLKHSSFSLPPAARQGLQTLLFRLLFALLVIPASIFALPDVSSAYNITPITWNVIGLDSNRPHFGPNRFPVGAKVCGGSAGTTGTATFTWETGGTNPDNSGAFIYLRPGSANPISFTYGADGCADAYFEVEVNRTFDSFYKTRRYFITAGGVSTPRPRELFVEKLISQSRNYITDVRLNGVSIPAGGAMNLLVGNTYTIQLVGGTATQGYNQFEKFINFPNTIFQILSVHTNYSANNSPYVSSTGHPYLYADACRWENDPASPYYRTCVSGNYKSGGSSVVTTYTVRIIGGGGSTERLSTLLYDFSGASFHYNADYSTGVRIANIIDPTSVNIAKKFTPEITKSGGIASLTFTLSNPNAGSIGGLSFTDLFPTSPADMTLASTSATNSCGGTLTDHNGNPLTVGNGGIRLTGGTIPANGSCNIQVSVTAPSPGAYTNTSGPLYINALNTGKTATATLTVDDTAVPRPLPPSSCAGQEVVLATWNFDNLANGPISNPSFSSKAANVAFATASYSGTGTNAVTTAEAFSGQRSWSGAGWVADDNLPEPNMSQTHFRFDVDTTNYGGVFIEFRAKIDGTNNWKGTNNNIRVWRSTNAGATFTHLAPDNTNLSTTWTHFIRPGNTTYAEQTTFGMQGYFRHKNNPSATLYLDDVVIKGCPVPANPPAPPTIAKVFSPALVAVGGTSTLTFTLSNPNSTQLTDVKFVDPLPGGVVVADNPAASTTCGGTPSWAPAAGASTLNFGQTTGATIPANSSCTVSVAVKPTTAGSHENVSGYVSAHQSGANTGPNGSARATLTALSPPIIAKQFAPNPILRGSVSTLTFTLTNPNLNHPITGVAFSDTLPTSPGNMVVAPMPNASTSGCGSPTFAPTAGTGSISFSGGAIEAGGACTVTLDITAPVVGEYQSISGNVSHILNGTWIGNTATDILTANPPSPAIALLKEVGLTAEGPWGSYLALPVGGDVHYRFTVENTGNVDLSTVSISDPVLGGAVSACNRATLAHYDDFTCTAGPIPASAGVHPNTATASGIFNGAAYTAQSTARYATTSLDLIKSAAQTHFTTSGNTLDYSFTVTNSGAAVLPGPVSLADDKTTVICPPVNTVGNFDNFLDPGESLVCTATYTTTAADVTAKQVTNFASASTPAYGASAAVLSNTASQTVPLASNLTAAKTNDLSGQLLTGASFNWTITVSNTVSAGDAVFSNGQVLLIDDMPASGAAYTLGTVTTAGATGAIACSIAANTLTCAADDGPVVIPSTLAGTIAVDSGSTEVNGTGTTFMAQLAAGSIIRIAGIPYTVQSVASDTELTLATPYAGETVSGLQMPGSFSISVSVRTLAAGDLVNPRSGGACRANPADAVPEIDGSNNDCGDSVTVLPAPNITVLKSVQTFWDPVNGGTNPYAIPGAHMLYTITATNFGGGATDADTVILTDVVPDRTDLVVSGSPIISFTDGATASGLTFDPAADVTFFDAADTEVDPAADDNGADPAIRKIVINPKGAFLSSDGANHPNFTIRFRVRIK